MREMTHKVTILKLMNISIDDLSELGREVERENLCLFIEDSLRREGPKILLDENT